MIAAARTAVIRWTADALGRLDRGVRRVPAVVRRYPGLVAFAGSALTVVAIALAWADVTLLVTVGAALAGVWLGQSLSANQAREQAVRTEERLLAERRANFQHRTLIEISGEIEQLRDAAEEVLQADYAIRDNEGRARTEEFVRRRNEAQHAYYQVDTRVRVLCPRVSDAGIMAAIYELRKCCREVVLTSPRYRLEARKDGTTDQDLWNAPEKIHPAFDAATAVIGAALRDFSG